jgi:Domain of unknown function (DUF4384)
MIRRRRNIFCVAACLSVLLATLGLQTETSGAPARARDSLDGAAANLVGTAFGPRPCPSGNARRSLGLWVFEEDRLPIAPAAAKRLHQELVGRLLAVRPRCVDVIDSAGIDAIVNHLHRSGALEKSAGNVVAALAEAHQKVDLVVQPALYSQAGSIVLALLAVERVTGKTLAQTAPVEVPERYLGEDASDQAITLDVAIKAAAKHFASNAPEFKEVRPMGIFFEDTGAQPKAARYLMDQVMAALAEETRNVFTGRVLSVRGLTIAPVAKADGAVEPQALEPPKAPTTDSSTYDLSGRYWLRGNAVQVQFSVRRADGTSLAWQGKVRTSEFKDLELRPTNPAAALHPPPKGPFVFQLTSPKGTAPIYRPGDELTLYMRLGQDAFVYCFYVDSKGSILTVLPNPVGAGAGRPNRFAANVLHYLPQRDPDGKYHPFQFTDDTTGEELFTCFATTRNIGVDLPPALFPATLATVPFLTLEQLRKLFAGLKDAQLSEASVTVTVAQ